MKKVVALTLALLMVIACAGMLSSCKSTEKLVVYTEAGFAPFEYVSDGKIVGVDVDIMNLVGEKLNKEVEFENVEFKTIVSAVKDGKLTNVGAAGISITPARQKDVDFSTEYYTAALYVIYPKADAESYEILTTDNVKGIYWSALAGKTIAVQSGTTADLFLSDEIEGGVLKDTNTSPSRFSELASAVADVGISSSVLIIDELPAKKLIEKNSNLTCAPLYYEGDDSSPDEAAVDVYAICVTKGQTELLNAINEVLDELGAEGVQKLVDKHLGLE